MIGRIPAVARAAAIAFAALAAFALPAAAQKKGGTFIVASEGEPAVLTAHLSTDTSAVMIA